MINSKTGKNWRNWALGSALGAGVLLAVAGTGAPALAQSGGISQAQSLYDGGSYRKAQEMLRGMLRSNPRNAQARLLQSQVYLRMGQGIAAQTEVEQARQAGIPNADTRHIMAEALVLQRRFTDALKEADASAVPARFSAQGARVRGLAYMGLKQNDQAKAQFQQAEQIDPRDPLVKIDYGRALVVAGDRVNGEAAIDRALALAPTNVRALVLKGDIARANRGLAQALPFFDRAIQADPQNLEARLERAATLVDLRQVDRARGDLKMVYAQAPNHPLALYLDAVLLSRQRKFQDAQALLARTKGALDNYPPAMMLQGIVAYELNNTEVARQYLSKLVQIAPESTMARRVYAATLLRLGDFKGALDVAKPLIDKGQADSRLLALVGSAYARSGDFNNAQKYFEQAVESEPNQSALRAQLAMSRVAVGQNQKATEDLQAILKQDPKSLQALTMLGIIDLRSGNFKVAQQTALRLVRTYPELPLGYNLLASSFLGQSKFKEAEANYRVALQKKPDYHEARRNLAQLLRATGRFEEARRELTRVLDTDRANVRTMLALADLSGAQGRSDERIEWLRRAVGAKPTLLPPRLALVTAYLQSGERDKALTEARSVSRDFPNEPASLEALGRAQASLGQFNDAASSFQKLVNMTPNAPGGYQLLARAYWSNKRYDDARRVYRQAMTLKNVNLGPVVLDLMNFEAQRGNYDQALSYATQLRKEFPRTSVADATIGDIYMGAKQWAKAAQSYEAARKVSLTKPVAFNLGEAYFRQGKLEAAVAVVRDFNRRKPTDIAPRMVIADFYMRAKRYDLAKVEYETLVKSAPSNAAMLNNLAWVYQSSKDPRALATGEKAYKLAPNSPEIADTLAWILLRNGKDAARALLLSQRAIEKRPNSPDMRYHYAVALRANGRSRDAVNELTSLLAKYPKFDTLTDARALLADIRAKGR